MHEKNKKFDFKEKFSFGELGYFVPDITSNYIYCDMDQIVLSTPNKVIKSNDDNFYYKDVPFQASIYTDALNSCIALCAFGLNYNAEPVISLNHWSTYYQADTCEIVLESMQSNMIELGGVNPDTMQFYILGGNSTTKDVFDELMRFKTNYNIIDDFYYHHHDEDNSSLAVYMTPSQIMYKPSLTKDIAQIHFDLIEIKRQTHHFQKISNMQESASDFRIKSLYRKMFFYRYLCEVPAQDSCAEIDSAAMILSTLG